MRLALQPGAGGVGVRGSRPESNGWLALLTRTHTTRHQGIVRAGSRPRPPYTVGGKAFQESSTTHE
jgi:hypothetical protein